MHPHLMKQVYKDLALLAKYGYASAPDHYMTPQVHVYLDQKEAISGVYTSETVTLHVTFGQVTVGNAYFEYTEAPVNNNLPIVEYYQALSVGFEQVSRKTWLRHLRNQFDAARNHAVVREPER